MNPLEKGSDIKALEAKLKADEQKFRERMKIKSTPVTHCSKCGNPIMEEDYFYGIGGEDICEKCIDYYK